MNYLQIFKENRKISLFLIDKKGHTLKKEILINYFSAKHYTATEKESKSRFFINFESENVMYFHGWNVPIYTPEPSQFSGKGVFFFTGKSLNFVAEYIEKNAKGNYNKGDIIYLKPLKDTALQQFLVFPNVYSSNKYINEFKFEQELAEQFLEYEKKAMRENQINFYERWRKNVA